MDRQDVGTAQIIRGNALDLPLADGSVDLIVTSPPYFGLRSYQDGGEHYEGQIGDEATPAEFVDALVAATAEMVRVLKPSGSIWVNLGDKHAASGTMQTKHGLGSSSLSSGVYMEDALEQPFKSRKFDNGSVRHKSLIGVPWRYALRCIDDLGIILRAEVIWSKPNGLPESVTDRVRRSHETWFHFTKSPRYFSAVDEIREAYEPESQSRRIAYGANAKGKGRGITPDRSDAGRDGVMGFGNPENINPLGKLPGSVWQIPTQPLRVPEHLGIDHFAAFPMEWPRRIIRGWSPSGVCVECGEGRRPVVTKTGSHREGGYRADNNPLMRRPDEKRTSIAASTLGMVSEFAITGETCACIERHRDCQDAARRDEPDAMCDDCYDMVNETGAGQRKPPPTRPAVVLDPFGGTGTTTLVAKALGRHGISNDMSADYCRLATWRTNDEGELARAMQVEKPAVQVQGQADLFDLIGEATA